MEDKDEDYLEDAPRQAAARPQAKAAKRRQRAPPPALMSSFLAQAKDTVLNKDVRVAMKRGRKLHSTVDTEGARLATSSSWVSGDVASLATKRYKTRRQSDLLEPEPEPATHGFAIQTLLDLQKASQLQPNPSSRGCSEEDEEEVQEDSSEGEEEREWSAPVLSERQQRQCAAKLRPPPPAVVDDGQYVADMLTASLSAFDEAFDWDDKKKIAVRSYFAILAAGLPIMNAAEVAAVASGADERTVQSLVADFENNKGWFSESLWGTNTKTPSLMADVEHRLWARQWVLANIGHKKDGPNCRAVDFNVVAHEHFGYVYDPKAPVISLKCATSWLNTVVGAKYGQTKKDTFNDGHGKGHVILQRHQLIKYYREVYGRGPNYVSINGQWVDKDKLRDLLETGLTETEHCIGPRGINMGGAFRPSTDYVRLSFVPSHIDRPGKRWILICHDECCVHTNEGEAYCWKIPGIEMGDCPPKSKGDIIHLADANAELKSGCLSLNGELGMITRKEMRHYIHEKHAGRAVAVPIYNTVIMHVGASGGGYWTGEDAMMQFEMTCDQYDVLFNMPWITDPMKATSVDILALTDEQRAEFMYGLCEQVDRSQNHLRRPPDGLNVNNGSKINKGTAPGQPHFRSTRAPLPEGHTDWRSCRRRLCTPNCGICEAAAVKYGHHPDFQSVGKKGAKTVLQEMGLDSTGNLPVLLERLQSQPNWGQMTSHAIEIFESRYHTCLIGAAYHAELASQEHRWRRLKQLVKSFVDGTVATCRQLIESAWGSLDGKSTFEDARSCRETMTAYEKLKDSGTEVSLKALQSEFFKIKKEHRGVYDAQKDQLMAILETPQDEKQKRNARIVQSRVDTGKLRKRLNDSRQDKTEKRIRSIRNRSASNFEKGKADAAVRKRKHTNKFSEEEYNHKNRRIKRKKDIANIFTDPNDL